MSESKFEFNIVNFDNWCQAVGDQNVMLEGLPPIGAFRIALWEKPYILKWFKTHHMHKAAVAAQVAFRRTHKLNSSYSLTPSQAWVERNLRHVALWSLMLSRTLPREMYGMFQDEIEESATKWRSKLYEDEITTTKKLIENGENPYLYY